MSNTINAVSYTHLGPYKSTEMIALNIYNSAFGANEFGFAQAKACLLYTSRCV